MAFQYDIPFHVDLSGRAALVTGVVLPVDGGYSAYSGV